METGRVGTETLKETGGLGYSAALQAERGRLESSEAIAVGQRSPWVLPWNLHLCAFALSLRC